MDLAELKFVVNTDELKTAADRIKALGDEITKLQSVQKTSLAQAKDEAAADKVRIKAQTDMANLKAKLASAENKAKEAAEGNTAATKAAISESDKLQALLGRLTNKWQDMAAGSTSAEASILNVARGMGATSTDALAPVKALLENIRSLSKSPFDSAIGSIRSITQELTSLNQRSALASKEIFLTGQQLREYSKIANEVQGKFAAMDIDPFKGTGLSEATAEINKQQDAYLGLVKTVNALKNAETERQSQLAPMSKTRTEQPMDVANAQFQRQNAQAMNESAKAAAYLEKELKRVDFVLQEVNSDLQMSNSNRLIKFQEHLTKTGVTGVQAAGQLETYRKKLEKIQSTSAFKKQTDDLKEYQNKVDYVTRAVGPQLTDIFSGLLTGQQSLYTIAVQQGGQLADQISLAGIEANKMGGILASALPNMYKNIANIGKAFGTMAVGGLQNLGSSLVDLTMKLPIAGKALRDMEIAYVISASAGDKFAQGMLKVVAGVRILSGVLAVGVIGALVGLGVAMYQVIKQQDAFAVSLALNGASLGLSQVQAIGYAQSLNAVGISTTKALDVISAMAKEGGFVKEEIKLVTESAVNMQKYAGVAIEDTVKAFAKLKGDPVKAMYELAMSAGNIAPEVIRAVAELQSLGRTAEAVALAMNAMKESNRITTEQMKQDFSGFALFMKGLSTGIAEFFENVFKGLMYKASPVQALEGQLASVQEKILSTRANLSTLGSLGIGGDDRTLKALEYEARMISSQISGLTVKNELTTQNQQRNSEAARALQINAGIEEGLNAKLLSGSKTRVTQTEYVAKAVQNYRKELKGAAVDAGVLAKVEQVATQEWLTSQKKAAVDRPAKLLAKDLEVLADIKNKALGLNRDYNDSERTLTRLREQDKISVDEYRVALTELNDQQPRAIKLATAVRELAKAWEDTVKAQAKKDEDFFKDFDAAVQVRKELQGQTAEIEFQRTLVGKTEEQQKHLTQEFQTQTKLKQDQFQLEKDLLDIREKYKGDALTIKMFEEEAYMRSAERIKATNAGVALQYAQDMQKEFDSIKATITDAVVTALFDGGKAGSQKLRDSIKAAFRNKITVVIDAVVNTVMGSMGSVAQTAMSVAGGSSGGIMGSMSNIYSMMRGGSSLGIAGTAAGSLGEVSSFLFDKGFESLGQTALDTANGILKFKDAINTGGDILGYATAAYSLSQGKYGAAAGQAIGTFFGGPIGSFIGGSVGGLLDSAFGWGSKSPTSSTGGASMSFNAANQRTAYNPYYDSRQGSNPQTDAVVYGLQQSYMDATKALGIAAEATTFIFAGNTGKNGKNPNFYMGGGTASNKFYQGETTKSDAAIQLAASRAVFAAVKGSALPRYLAGVFDGMSASAMSEEQINAVIKTAQSFKILHDSLLNLPFVNLMDMSYATAKALTDAVGGMDAFNTKLSSYYSNFYSQEEQKVQTAKNINKILEGTGFDAANATREQFKALVNAQDVSTVAGRAMYATLLGVADAFASITPSIEDTTTAAQALVQAMIDSSKKLQDAINEVRGTQVSPAETVKNQQYEFDKTYAMALATTGETRIGYADELAAILPDLSEAIKATSGSTAEWMARTAAAFGQAQNLANLMGTGAGATTVSTTGTLGATTPAISTLSAPGSTSIVFDNSAVVTAVQALNANIDLLRIEVQADVQHNAKTAKLLDRVIPDGQSVQVKIAV